MNRWYRAYHGTSADEWNEHDENMETVKSIYNQGLRVSSSGVYGVGVYTSMDPTFAIRHGYVGTSSIQVEDGSTKKYWFMLQVGVNPDGLLTPQNGGTSDLYSDSDTYSRTFLVGKTTNDVRPYGFLIREYDEKHQEYCNSCPYKDTKFH